MSPDDGTFHVVGGEQEPVAMFRPIRRGNVRIYGCSPGCLVISIVLSVVLTILLNLLIRAF